MKKETELGILRADLGEVPTFCVKHKDFLEKFHGLKIVQCWRNAFY